MQLHTISFHHHPPTSVRCVNFNKGRSTSVTGWATTTSFSASSGSGVSRPLHCSRVCLCMCLWSCVCFKAAAVFSHHQSFVSAFYFVLGFRRDTQARLVVAVFFNGCLKCVVNSTWMPLLSWNVSSLPPPTAYTVFTHVRIPRIHSTPTPPQPLLRVRHVTALYALTGA